MYSFSSATASVFGSRWTTVGSDETKHFVICIDIVSLITNKE